MKTSNRNSPFLSIPNKQELHRRDPVAARLCSTEVEAGFFLAGLNMEPVEFLDLPTYVRKSA